MVNSLNFRQNINSTNTIQATSRGLKSSAMMRTQPQRDVISFKALTPAKCEKILIKNAHPHDIKVTKITQIEVQQKQGRNYVPIKAYLAEAKLPNSSMMSLGVFSSNEKLLGDIAGLMPQGFRNGSHEKKLFPQNRFYLHMASITAHYEKGYKGIGTALITAAKAKSTELGLDGQISLLAYNGYKNGKGSPIPFYAKMGFVPINKPALTKEEIIEKYRDENEARTMVLLTPKNLERLKELKSKPTR